MVASGSYFQWMRAGRRLGRPAAGKPERDRPCMRATRGSTGTGRTTKRPPDSGYYAPSHATPTTREHPDATYRKAGRTGGDGRGAAYRAGPAPRPAVQRSDQAQVLSQDAGAEIVGFSQGAARRAAARGRRRRVSQQGELPEGVRARPDRGRLSPTGPGTTRARRRCWSASSRSTCIGGRPVEEYAFAERPLPAPGATATSPGRHELEIPME